MPPQSEGAQESEETLMDLLSFLLGLSVGYLFCLFAAWKDGMFKE